MKRFFSGQLINVIFIVLVVGAALTIYFLSHAQAQSSGEAASTASSPSATAASEESDTPAPAGCGGVPESVWLTHLESADGFTAKPVSGSERAWSLSCGTDPDVSAQMSYTVDGGCVSSVEFVFSLPEYTYDGDSDSAIERYLASSEEAALSARNDAVRILLSDLLPACDASDAVSLPTVLLWAESAAQIENEGDDYNDDENGVAFMAYRTQRKGADLLVCSFFMSF